MPKIKKTRNGKAYEQGTERYRMPPPDILKLRVGWVAERAKALEAGNLRRAAYYKGKLNGQRW